MGLCPDCLIKSGFPTGMEPETGSATQPTFVPPSVEEMGRLFPQLEILALIGKGGMGAVYQARQKRLDRLVALKILPPGTGSDPAFAERFTREAQALAKLNHPGIVTLYEFGETSGQFYFLMEYVDGVNLRQLLAGGRISAREALAIVPQICDALQFAHDQGIVHRDIKPENILLDRRGRVKVADFGLAKIVGTNAERSAGPRPGSSPTENPNEPGRRPALQELTDAGRVMGTPQYMSPEQICAPGEVDHRADIYALGVVFYQMLTGELPGKRLEPPSKKVRIDVRLDEVVLRALEQKPELRYQQVSEVKTMVETIVATPSGSSRREEAPSEKAETSNPSSPPTIGQARRFSRLSFAVVMSLVIIGAAVALFALIGRNTAPTVALSQSEFLSKFHSNEIAHATLINNPQTAPLIKIAGTYFKRDQGGKATKEEVPFVVNNCWLNPEMLNQLTHSDRVKMSVQNVVGINLFWGVAPFLILGLGILLILGVTMYIVWRTVNQRRKGTPAGPVVAPGSSRRQEAPTEKAGKTTAGISSWFVSPLASPEVREISAHLTPEERSETMLHGLLWGVWVMLATFGNLWLLKSFPAPGNWIVAAIIVALFLASLPPWLRMQRRFLGSTVWAREHGYAAWNIKLFSFTQPIGWRVLLVVGVASLLVLGQQKLFTHLSGTAELTESLKADAAQTRKQIARPSAQQHPNAVSPGHMTAHTMANAPFVARLPDGGSIELLAVRILPSTNELWWQPDGTPSAFDPSIQSEGGEPGNGISALVRIRFPMTRSQWPLPAGSNNPPGVELGTGHRFAVQGGRRLLPSESGDDPNSMYGVMTSEAPSVGANATTLSLKVAVEDWQRVAAQKPGWFAFLFAGAARKEWKFSETPEGNLKVTITHLTENTETEFRLVALDLSGTEYLPNLTQRTKRADEISATLEATFAPSPGSGDHWQLPLSRVREVHLEARPYERVEFRNVSLRPGYATKVEVKDFGDENPSL